jgi:hypothetical protein
MQLKTHVAGYRVGHYADQLGLVKTGPVQLVREPENIYDPNAIRLDYEGRKLGYVPRAHSTVLAKLIDSGTITVEAHINCETLPHDILLTIEIEKVVGGVDENKST